MSEDMPLSWSYISSARARLRSYVSRPVTSPRRLFDPHDQAQAQEGTGWRAWIKEKRRDGFGLRNGSTDIQLVNIFPGWAVRRYGEGDTQFPPQFEVEVFVSGFACTRRDPENATRSQRAFLRLAKSFAGLPNIVEGTADVAPYAPYKSSLASLTPQTEERLALIPPTDAESDASLDIEALDRGLSLAKEDDGEDGNNSETSSTYDDPLPSPGETSSDQDIPGPLHVLRRLHDNLEKRIRCLWYSALPNRTVRLHFLISPHRDTPVPNNHEASSEVDDFSLGTEDGYLAVQDVMTGPDGSFRATVRVKWEELCHHPRALHLVFGETIEDHDLLVVAKLLPYSNRPSPSHSPTNTRPSAPVTSTTPPLAGIARIPITHSPIRVISDIDDTVKLSGILSGARTVFHNVFVKDLRDNVIPGMGEWYMKMFSQGVRFHYVSNGPFAVLPILNDFFQVSQLPPGSLKLKSYAGRSIFDGLLSAPATRKRGGILEVLDAFPDSLFFLIGDTGEQDLELYADIARERPDQILGVFLRDARPDTPFSPEPLSDPTGLKAPPEARNPDERPPISRTQSSTGSLASLLRRFPSYRTKDSIWRTTSLPSMAVSNTVTAIPNNNNNASSKPTRSTVNTVPSASPTKQKEISRGAYFGFGPLTSQPEEESDSINSPPGSALAAIRQTFDHSSPSSTIDQVFITEPPKPIPSPSITVTKSPAPSFSSKRAGSTSSMSSVFENGGDTGQTFSGTLRDQLQKRVYRSRRLIPEHIVLRVFGDPSECVEVDEILRREG